MNLASMLMRGLGRSWEGAGFAQALVSAAVPILLAAAPLLLVGCAPPSSESQRNVVPHPDFEPGMACGTVGNIILKVPTKYTFLGVTYEGVDYWGGKGYLNRTKWCDDQLQDATLSVTWPELDPAGGVSWYTSEDPRYITISVSPLRARPPEESMSSHLERAAGDGLFSNVLRDIEEISEFKVWSESLGLYMVDANTYSPNNRRRVYWAESEDGVVTLLIVCKANLTTGVSRCRQISFDRERGIWLGLNYRAGLLQSWRILKRSSIDLIDQFTIRRKGEQ